MDWKTGARIAQRAATISLAATLGVVAVKAYGAYRSGSISVLAETIQSSVDILMSVTALLTIRYAARPPDASHPYGHGKAESLGSALQMLIVLGSGIYILFEAYRRLLEPRPVEWNWGAGAMAAALLADLALTRYLRMQSQRTGSVALESEAVHLRADSLAAGGVLAGMLLVGFTGQPILDPVVAAVFAVVTMGLALSRLREVIHPLMDGALPESEIGTIEIVLKEHEAVRGFHDVRTRRVGVRRWIDLHVLLDDGLSFVQAHELAEEIEKKLSAALGGAAVTIHYEPHRAELAHRAREHTSGDEKP
jgi:cation diffusion facilitator family transporter